MNCFQSACQNSKSKKYRWTGWPLTEQNHTPVFWNIVKAQAPTMEKAKAWLQKNGALLEQEL
jgi:hypothetical protein